MEQRTKITPAPGFVQVVQDKSAGGEIGGIQIAAKENPMHEGQVMSIGGPKYFLGWRIGYHIPARFRHMNLRVGDTVTFARFNAVKGAQQGEDWLFVGMQHIVCKKESVGAYSKWQKLKGWFNLSIISLSFAAGWFSVGVFNRLKPYFKKGA